MDNDVAVITAEPPPVKSPRCSDEVTREVNDATADFSMGMSVLVLILIIFYILWRCFKSRARFIRAFLSLCGDITVRGPCDHCFQAPVLVGQHQPQQQQQPQLQCEQSQGLQPSQNPCRSPQPL